MSKTIVRMRCTIHNLEYQTPSRSDDEDATHMECAACGLAKIRRLQKQLAEVTAHREALLMAIDLKKTQVEIGS